MGVTLDTGALIALERRRLTMQEVYATALANGTVITVPTVVVAEWWRAGHREKERAIILRSVHVEPLDDRVARIAGLAVGMLPGAGTIDAIIMASASSRGDAVYTSDPNDLEALRSTVAGFANVRVIRT